MDQCTVTQLHAHVWMLRDEHNDTCYLAVGEQKALLVDTMCGYTDVLQAARTVTDKPIVVVNTHGHGDHVLGNVWFKEAYMHPDDLFMIEQMMQDERLRQAMAEQGLSMSSFLPVKAGDVFDLGGLTAEVIALPGHTPGGICLLLREDRLLFTGDSINRHLWMQLEGCLPLREYAKKLEALLPLAERADHILHGHASGMEPISLIGELREGALQIARGETEGDAEYRWFGGVCRQHPFGKDSVIVYRPENQG